MKVSVIIPVYQVEKYLSDCLDSVLAQTYEDLEIILIDDGSRDHTLEICHTYAEKDSRILVVHQENQGVSAARNHGLSICNGTYITFVDGDDIILPEYVAHLVDALQSTGSRIARSQRKVGNHVDEYPVCYDGNGWASLAFSELPSFCMLAGVNSLMIHRKLLEELRFDEKIRYAEDTLFNTALVSSVEPEKVVFVRHTDYIYEMRGNSNSGSDTKNLEARKTQYVALQKIYSICKQHPSILDTYHEYLFAKLTVLHRALCQCNSKTVELEEIQIKSARILKKMWLKGYRPEGVKNKLILYMEINGLYWILKSYFRVKDLFGGGLYNDKKE